MAQNDNDQNIENLNLLNFIGQDLEDNKKRNKDILALNRQLETSITNQITLNDTMASNLRATYDIERSILSQKRLSSKIEIETKKLLSDIHGVEKDNLILSSQRINENRKSIASLSEELEKKKKILQTQTILGQNTSSIQSEINSNLVVQQSLEKEIQDIKNQNSVGDVDKLSTLMQQNEILSQQLNINRESLNESKKLDLKEGIFGGLLKGLKKIPFLGDILDVDGAREAMRETAAAGGSWFKTLGSGIQALGPSLKAALGPIAWIGIAVSAFKSLLDLMFKADEEATKLAKSLGISKEQARETRDHLTDVARLSDNIYVTTTNLVEAQLQLNDAYGVGMLMSDEVLKSQILLTKNIGLSVEAANGLNSLFIVSNTNVDKGRKSILGQVASLSNQKGILLDSRKVLEDVAKVNGQIAIQYQNNPDKIAKAVVQVKALGLELEQARKIGDSLLDFSSSIENELEAELLLGKEINLEKARGFALSGDIASATEEVLGQVGSLADFQKLNVIQQNSLAKAVGLSTDELSNSLIIQTRLKNISDDQKESIEKRVQALKREGKSTEEQEELRKKLLMTDADSLDNALKSLSAQDSFNQSLEKAKDIFAKLANSGVLDSLAKILENLVDFLGTSKREQAGTITENIKGNKNISSINKSKAEELTDKIKSNEYKSNVPFLGMIGREERKEENKLLLQQLKDIESGKSPDSSVEVQKPVSDFIMRGNKMTPFRKDDLIIGGTKLMDTPKPQTSNNDSSNDEVIKLLKDINKHLAEGKHIYLDGQKVGNSIVKNSHQAA